ncbi:MAG: hypothetical protein MJB14_07255 [Spirochaetes bacterium]|nr:hypothetical protein [Spirochaetota bacterium]
MLVTRKKILIILLLIFSIISLFSIDMADYGQWFHFDIEKIGNQEWKTAIVDAPQFSYLRIYHPAESSHKILVLINSQASWSDTAISKILEIYADKQFFPEFAVVRYQKDETLLKQVLDWAVTERIELIFPVGSSVLAQVHPLQKNKYIPVVSVCNKDPVLLGYINDYEQGSGNNFVFTSVNTPIDVQIAFLKKLKPDLKNVAILVARSNNSAMKTQYYPLKKALLEENIAVFDIVLGPEKSIPDLQDVIQEELPGKMMEVIQKMKIRDPNLQNSFFWLTYSTSVVKNLTTINEHCENIPVLGVATDTVKEGKNSAVIGIGVSFSSNAYLAANYGIRILKDKENPGDLKVGVVSPPDIAINFLVAQMIGYKIPFSFFESASIIFDHQGNKVRDIGTLF